MEFCKSCVYPEIAVNVTINRSGICSACIAESQFVECSEDEWVRRRDLFRKLTDKYRRSDGSNYDCIIAVSGGKDSYFQSHIAATEFGLKALLVTYHGNNYLPEGQANLDRMREKFDADHVILGPSIETLVKLNRIGFKLMGDMNWHAHAGIKIVPIQMAVRFRIPLVIWGEPTWSISGMFLPDDFVEYNRRTVAEHDLRGFTWKDFVGEEGLAASDLTWLRLPEDQEIENVGVRGIYIGNYFPWRPVEHTQLVEQRYGFERARVPFERTYRDMSNLDDMHENGIHDYMKFVKFGYGRASDHASKDIRAGLISRERAIQIVKHYDHVKPYRDLTRWLSYVNMTEQEFDEIADRFRDPRVWFIRENQWTKFDVTGELSSYGDVKLRNRSQLLKFRVIQ
jgi:N-acetyl sugar amidotransferase